MKVKILLSILLFFLLYGFKNNNPSKNILENTNWKIIYINNFTNGKETIWTDFSKEQNFILSFKKACVRKNETEYGLSLSSDTVNLHSSYYCHVNRGSITFNKANRSTYKISMPIYKGCNLSGTNLFIPLLSVLNHQSGTYNLSNDTLILLGTSNSAGNIKMYLVKKN